MKRLMGICIAMFGIVWYTHLLATQSSPQVRATRSIWPGDWVKLGMCWGLQPCSTYAVVWGVAWEHLA